MEQTQVVNVILDGLPDPLGFVEITDETTLEDARKLIVSEVEGIPSDFRFLMNNNNVFVKVSLPQEAKKKAVSLLKPTGTLIIKDNATLTKQPSSENQRSQQDASAKNDTPNVPPISPTISLSPSSSTSNNNNNSNNNGLLFSNNPEENRKIIQMLEEQYNNLLKEEKDFSNPNHPLSRVDSLSRRKSVHQLNFSSLPKKARNFWQELEKKSTNDPSHSSVKDHVMEQAQQGNITADQIRQLLNFAKDQNKASSSQSSPSSSSHNMVREIYVTKSEEDVSVANEPKEKPQQEVTVKQEPEIQVKSPVPVFNPQRGSLGLEKVHQPEDVTVIAKIEDGPQKTQPYVAELTNLIEEPLEEIQEEKEDVPIDTFSHSYSNSSTFSIESNPTEEIMGYDNDDSSKEKKSPWWKKLPPPPSIEENPSSPSLKRDSSDDKSVVYEFENDGHHTPVRRAFKRTVTTIKRLENFIVNRPPLMTLLEKNIMIDTDLPHDVTRANASKITPTSSYETLDDGKPTLVKSPSRFALSSSRNNLVDPPAEWRIEGGSKIQLDSSPLECAEKYEAYYKTNFSNKDHINFLGVHQKYGPIVVSVMKETEDQSNYIPAIIRTEKEDQRIFAEAPSGKKSRSRDLIKIMQNTCPLLLSDVKFSGIHSADLVRDLVQFEQNQVVKNMKVGLIYCAEGQTTDDEMFSNVSGSSEFEDFLKFLGDEVDLKGFSGFNGGLDVKNDNTGTQSIYTRYMGVEVMFHVSTMIPYTQNDPQQVERKRHVGNDVVIIVFKHGSTPFSPSVIKSQFNHIFIVVQPEPKKTPDTPTQYKVAICSKRGVPPFGPQPPWNSVFLKDTQFRNFLFTKMLNGERAAMQAPIFATKLEKARKELLKRMVDTEYVEEENTGSPRKLHSLRHFGSESKSGVVSVTLTAGDLTIKTGVDADSKVYQLLERMEKKLPPSSSGYSLWMDGAELDAEKSLVHYRSQSNKLIVEAKPLPMGSPKPNRRIIRSTSKTLSLRLKKPFYGLSPPPSEIDAKEEETETNGSVLTRTENVSETDTKKEAIEVLAVTIRTPSLTIATKVPSTAKLTDLYEKMKAKFPNENYHLYLDSKPLDLQKTLNDFRKGTDQKSMILDFGPEPDKKNKKDKSKSKKKSI